MASTTQVPPTNMLVPSTNIKGNEQPMTPLVTIPPKKVLQQKSSIPTPLVVFHSLGRAYLQGTTSNQSDLQGVF